MLKVGGGLIKSSTVSRYGIPMEAVREIEDSLRDVLCETKTQLAELHDQQLHDNMAKLHQKVDQTVSAMQDHWEAKQLRDADH